MLHVYKSNVSVAVFDDLKNTGFNRLKVVLFGPEFLKPWRLKEEGNIPYNNQLHIVECFKS